MATLAREALGETGQGWRKRDVGWRLHPGGDWLSWLEIIQSEPSLVRLLLIMDCCLCYTCVGTQNTLHWAHCSFTPRSHWWFLAQGHEDRLLWAGFVPPTSYLTTHSTSWATVAPLDNNEFFIPGRMYIIQFLKASLMCVDRTDFGPEDGDGEEGGTAVFHEDVHGLTALIHLPHEVCDCVNSVPSVNFETKSESF